ncbi:MAG: hypothetical protein HZA89_04075 [Verrucomicrobia bacterium]|nr:hypothetical protein [Verrucomicrobiota bacterium]
MPPSISWPEGKRFAFTIFDDTDAATVANVKPVYDLLRDCGLRTTKSVWPLAGTEPPAIVGGATCADADYLAWVRQLQREGFEIGFHNATYHSSKRARTLEGLDEFARLFGHAPRAMANHTICREGIYWGSDRVTGVNRVIYNATRLFRNTDWFRGHVEGDEFFWGDLCRERVKYVRNFIFADLNTLKECPLMPYHDPVRPWVNHWYASSEGTNVRDFNATLAEANQDRLEAEGGACIMYSHLAKGFFTGGELNPRFNSLIERLGRKNGWFVPVSDLLDYLIKVKGEKILTPGERAALERRWLRHKFRVGTT